MFCHLKMSFYLYNLFQGSENEILKLNNVLIPRFLPIVFLKTKLH